MFLWGSIGALIVIEWISGCSLSIASTLRPIIIQSHLQSHHLIQNARPVLLNPLVTLASVCRTSLRFTSPLSTLDIRHWHCLILCLVLTVALSLEVALFLFNSSFSLLSFSDLLSSSRTVPLAPAPLLMQLELLFFLVLILLFLVLLVLVNHV